MIPQSIKDYIIKNYKINYEYYQQASAITNINPYVFAAIHYREHSMGLNYSGPGGPLQFDPPLSDKQVKNLLLTYTTIQEPDKYTAKAQNDNLMAIVLCGCFLQNKLHFAHLPLLNLKADNILTAKAFELYNGTAYGSPDKSPYVSNMLDEKHMNMIIRGTYLDKFGKRQKVQVVDRRPGAMTVYLLLKDLKNE